MKRLLLLVALLGGSVQAAPNLHDPYQEPACVEVMQDRELYARKVDRLKLGDYVAQRLTAYRVPNEKNDMALCLGSERYVRVWLTSVDVDTPAGNVGTAVTVNFDLMVKLGAYDTPVSFYHLHYLVLSGPDELGAALERTVGLALDEFAADYATANPR